MKLKKILAGLLVGVMVIGCVPQSLWGTAEKVEAANNEAQLTGLRDQEGRACTFIALHGDDTSGTSIHNSGSLLFDYNGSGGNYVYTTGGNGNTVVAGNYVGLIYNEAFTMKSVRFTFAPSSESSTDHFYASKLQYLPDGENAEWTDVEGVTFGNVTTCSAALPTSLWETPIKGIRLVNTGADHAAWIRVKEIEVNAHGLHRTRITDLHGNTGRLEVLYQGLGYANGRDTYQNGTAGSIFDGKDATGVIYRGNSDGTYSNDNLAAGDYVAVIYDHVIDINSIRFLFDSSADSNKMSSATLQYTTDGSSWEAIPNLSDVGNQAEVMITEEQLPADFQAKGVRILNNTTIRKWLRVYEIQVNGNPFWIDSDVPSSSIAEVTAGSAQNSTTGGDQNANGAIDSDVNTWWHSNYNNGDNGKLGKFWYDVKFTENTLVDGVRVLPRVQGGNGIITRYEIWVSTEDTLADLPDYDTDATAYANTWKAQFTKVCEGTWANNSDGRTVWKTAKFEPVEARHVRIVATETKGQITANNNKFVTIAEFRVTKAAENTSFFNGGSLRMDCATEEDPFAKTYLRFEYIFPQTFNEMTVVENQWSWDYTTTEGGATRNVQVQDGKWTLRDGKYYSNLVFKNITSTNYNRPIYSKLVVKYANSDDSENITVYSSVKNRSVQYVAERIAADPAVEQAQSDYALGILGKLNMAMVQLGTTKDFNNGGKVNIDSCLYTFEKSGTEGNIYTISSTTDNGTKVYLNSKSGVAQAPNQTAATTFEVSNQVTTDLTKFSFEDKSSASGGAWLYFHDGDNLYFNRNGSYDSSHCNYELYKKAEVSDGQTIKGYEKISGVDQIEDNGQYLIVATGTGTYAGSYYVLHPSTSGTNYAHVAKLVVVTE